MKVKKSYTTKEVLDSTLAGIEFEFYSNFDDIIDTARSIAKYIGKRVIVPMALGDLKNPKPLYHSPIKPTSDIFKLEPDYSGGKKMCELVTGPMAYAEARNIIIKMFEWIGNNGYTNERCSIHANISIDKNKMPTRFEIPNMNVLKFILSFDESRVYDVFPNRKESVYSRSIKEIRANKNSLFISKDCPIYSTAIFKVPEEKYYGVNFIKREKNYLEYRYMGGAGYEKKTRKILDLIEYFVAHLHSVLNFTQYENSEIREFKALIEKQNKIAEGFTKYAYFKKACPEIKVTWDMNDNEDVLEGVWGNLKNQLFEIMMTGGMTKGEFNYDSEVGKFQLKNTKLKNCRIADLEIIQCEIEGVLERCSFYNSKLRNSRFVSCTFGKNNVINFSKIQESPLHVSNICNDCFIENKSNIINCEVNRGVIRNGEIGELAKISAKTNIVEQKEPVETAGSYKNVVDGAKDSDKEKKKSK